MIDPGTPGYLVLGFCRCVKCGFQKFYFNTNFICANCGNRTYIKTTLDEDLRNELSNRRSVNEKENDRAICDDVSDGVLSDNNVFSMWRNN